MSKEAMRLALDALKPYKSNVLRQYTPTDAAIDTLTKALALPDAKPVAWMRPSVEDYDSLFRDARVVEASKATGATHWDKNGWLPLFATPQPATAQPAEPLFDEHIDNLGFLYGVPPSKRNDFARAIEAAHGIHPAKENHDSRPHT